MISAERMKSVRTAPRILSRSRATRSTVASPAARISSAAWAASSSVLCSQRWASFSTPSKQR